MTTDSYIEVYSIIEGAVGDERIAHTDEQADRIIEAMTDEAEREGFGIEVYTIPHCHAPDFDGECVCVQWLTDHNPVATANVGDR